MFYNNFFSTLKQDLKAAVKPYPLSEGSCFSAIEALRSSIQNGIFNIKKNAPLLIFGQILSVVLAISGGAQATLHTECHISAPNFGNALVYIILALHVVPLIIRGQSFKNSKKDDDVRRVLFAETDSSLIVRNDDDSMSDTPPAYSFLFGLIPLHAPAWAYFFMAIADVEGNYMVVRAFQYSSFSYNMVIDYLSVAVAMMLSWSFLNREYTSAHMIGATICILGAHLNAVESFRNWNEDEDFNKDDSPSHFGALLAIVAAIMFGANLFLTEVFVRDMGGPVETLAMRGLFGAPLALLQSRVFERDALTALFFATPSTATNGFSEDHTCSHEATVTLLLSFVAMSTLRYVGISQFFSYSEVGLLSISFLTADMWLSLFSFVSDRIYLPWSITSMILGIFLYQAGTSPIQEDSKKSAGQTKENNDYQDIEISSIGLQNIIMPPSISTQEHEYW